MGRELLISSEQLTAGLADRVKQWMKAQANSIEYLFPLQDDGKEVLVAGETRLGLLGLFRDGRCVWIHPEYRDPDERYKELSDQQYLDITNRQQVEATVEAVRSGQIEKLGNQDIGALEPYSPS